MVEVSTSSRPNPVANMHLKEADEAALALKSSKATIRIERLVERYNQLRVIQVAVHEELSGIRTMLIAIGRMPAKCLEDLK